MLAFIKMVTVRMLDGTRVKMEGNVTDPSKHDEKLSANIILSFQRCTSILNLDWIFQRKVGTMRLFYPGIVQDNLGKSC